MVAQARQIMTRRLDRTLEALPEGPFARPALAYVPGGPIMQAELAAPCAKAAAATAPPSAP